MIPLAHWLVEKAQEEQLHLMTAAAAPEESPEPCLEDQGQDAALAASSALEARLLELEQALREAEERLAHMAQEHARKEREITERLGDTLCRHLATEVATGFHSLARQVEEAVAEALMPFLEAAVRDRAVTSLVELIRQDMRNRDSAVLEIRAPAGLHGALAEAFGETGMTITISEAATVDVMFAGERLRFQDLASTWSATITKGET